MSSNSPSYSTASLHRGKGRPRCFDHDEALKRALALFWRKGYAPTSVSELCQAMGVNPPSLYAEFGNKAELFIEALNFYERSYWQAPSQRFLAAPDLYHAVAEFFGTAADILLSPSTPCGCMVVLAAINISESATDVIVAVNKMRQATKQMFADRLRLALNDGQIPADTDVSSLALALNTFLEGLSIQARDGLTLAELKAVAATAVRLLPRNS